MYVHTKHLIYINKVIYLGMCSIFLMINLTKGWTTTQQIKAGPEKSCARGKSLLELWIIPLPPDWQPPLILVRFISNYLCMCSNSMASAHVILK